MTTTEAPATITTASGRTLKAGDVVIILPKSTTSTAIPNAALSFTVEIRNVVTDGRHRGIWSVEGTFYPLRRVHA